jgi:EpsI family protein
MRSPRAFLPAAVLTLGCVFVLHTRSQIALPLAKPLSTVLAGMGGYRVQEQRVGDEERSIAGMTDYIARVYWRDSMVAFTTLVSYYDRQTQGKTIHSPRNCLPGAGWEVLSGGPSVIRAGGTTYTVNRYVLKNGAALAVAYYWYQGRGRVVASEYEVKWNLLRDAALAGHTEEALVRVVVPVPPIRTTDAAESARAYASADAMGTQVARMLIADVREALPGSEPGRSQRQTALGAPGTAFSVLRTRHPASSAGA